MSHPPLVKADLFLRRTFPTINWIPCAKPKDDDNSSHPSRTRRIYPHKLPRGKAIWLLSAHLSNNPLVSSRSNIKTEVCKCRRRKLPRAHLILVATVDYSNAAVSCLHRQHHAVSSRVSLSTDAFSMRLL